MWISLLTKELEIYLECELHSSVWADQNHWGQWLNMNPESESLFSVLADGNHWWEWLNTHPASEFVLQCLSGPHSPIMAEHPSSLWVTLRCSSRKGPLMKMANHPFREWVALVFKQITITDKNYWTPIQKVSCSLVFKQITITDKNGWTCI